jgi:16S rRNA (uracil1498-N3)-methyltransferase
LFLIAFIPRRLAVLERFYCPDPLVDGLAILEGDEARHLIRVRRVAVGELVELFDGRGTAYRARVESLGRDRAVLTIEEPAEADRTPRFSLTLATAVPKGERFDWLVEKATELGVARLIPLVTERSVVDPRSAKLDRLRRLIVEASKQCRRNRLMDLEPPKAWNALVVSATETSRLIAHPGGPGMVSAGLLPGSGSAILAIGPEGGFAEGEVARAVEAGWRPVGLGSTILRIETAALAGCSTILALTESIKEKEAT